MELILPIHSERVGGKHRVAETEHLILPVITPHLTCAVISEGRWGPCRFCVRGAATRGNGALGLDEWPGASPHSRRLCSRPPELGLSPVRTSLLDVYWPIEIYGALWAHLSLAFGLLPRAVTRRKSGGLIQGSSFPSFYRFYFWQRINPVPSVWGNFVCFTAPSSLTFSILPVAFCLSWLSSLMFEQLKSTRYFWLKIIARKIELGWFCWVVIFLLIYGSCQNSRETC